MQLHRLISASLVVGIAAGVTVIACGGGGSKTPDAKVFKDAPKQIDAPGSTSGIGKLCGTGSGQPSQCPTNDPICTSVTGTQFWCTEGCGFGSCASGGTYGSSSCGMNGSNQPTPPANGDSVCAQMKAGNPATPACALYGNGPNAGSAIAWACALLCGTAGSNNFGTCPTGLTCSGNFCQ